MKSKLEKISTERKSQNRFNLLTAIRDGIETGILAGAGVALLTSSLSIQYRALFTGLGGLAGGYCGYKSSIIRNNC